MKLIALLSVLVVVAWLGARSLIAEQHRDSVGSAQQGQQVVDGARRAVDAAQPAAPDSP